MFGWLRKQRRKQLQTRPFPKEWLTYLEDDVAFYPHLPENKREDFLNKLKIFVWEKYFFGAGGMELTEKVKVLIAAAAARLILFLDDSHYDRLTEIVVYPHDYKHPDEKEVIYLGEAHTWGTVVLSWPALLRGLQNPLRWEDVATHEFAHVLDVATGRFNGTPNLRSRKAHKKWSEVMAKYFLKLREGGPFEQPSISNYGAQSEAEYFAVATEAFFSNTRAFKRDVPEVFELFKAFFGWEPSDLVHALTVNESLQMTPSWIGLISDMGPKVACHTGQNQPRPFSMRDLLH